MNNFDLGVAAFQSGNLESAKQHFEQQLKLNPNEPNSLQLLGLVYSKMGNIDSAIAHMETSLKVAPKQPHVLNNLGNCFKKVSNFPEATKCYEKAIRLQPDYLDAYSNLILIHLALSELSRAKRVCEQGLEKLPNNLKLLKHKARCLRELNLFDESIKLYKLLLQNNSQAVDVLHDLGITYRLNGEPKEALSHYLTAARLGLDNYQLSHNIANAYSDMGDLQSAISFYSKAIQQNPGYVESHKNLNELLWETGDEDKLLNSYFYGFDRTQNNQDLKLAYARSLLRFSQEQQALDFLSPLANEFKTDPEFYDLLGLSLKGLDLNDKALEVMAQGVNLKGASNDQIINYSVLLMECGKQDLAREFLEAVIEKDQNDQMAIAYLQSCKRIQSLTKEFEFNDHADCVQEFTIDIPQGFDSIETFCAELKLYLDSLHTAEREPYEQTLKGGTQTRGNIFDDRNEYIQVLRENIEKCIEAYVSEIGPKLWSDDQLKLIKDYKFVGSWSVQLKEDGFHVPHIHPMGWISSCFYVDLPDEINDSNDCQGWFQIGQPKLSSKVELPPIKKFKPTVGHLLLFPSFLWHGTIPFKSEKARTTIAFDVAPSH